MLRLNMNVTKDEEKPIYQRLIKTKFFTLDTCSVQNDWIGIGGFDDLHQSRSTSDLVLNTKNPTPHCCRDKAVVETYIYCLSL